MFADDFHFVKIDTDEMEGGKDVFNEYKKDRQGGLPWMIILDGDGAELATSNDAKGNNCGCPVADHEIAHFVSMIKTSSGASDEKLSSIETAMKKYAETLK